MSGITTGVGLISGIDTATLIEQLLAVEARPKLLANQRIVGLQLIQTSYLDLASRLRGLETAATAFRNAGSIFQSKSAVSSLSDSILATASNDTPEGTFNFVVDRLVTTQQLLSRGFADRDSSPFGATSLTFESESGRLDTDALLADLNSGTGVRRGTIEISQGTETVQVDLSRAATVSEVVEAINQAEGVDVTASIKDGALHLTSNSPDDFTVSTATGSTGVAEDLGIDKTSKLGVLAGEALTGLDSTTLLRTLNDGNGVFVGNDSGISRHDFVINIDGTDVNINIGAIYEEVTVDGETTIEQTEAAPNDIAGVLDRINTQLTDAGYSEVSVSISGQGLALVDTSGRAVSVSEKNATSTTASDLGLLGSDSGGTITGRRLVAGLGTVLLSNLNGGTGLAGNGEAKITTRDGDVLTFDLSAAETVEDIVNLINDDATNAGRINVSLNSAGSGLAIADTTGGTGNLIITGDAAVALGIATDIGGVAEDSFRGTNLQRKYVSNGTLLKDLSSTGSLGTGSIRITDGFGASTTINIGDDTQSVFDLISEVNGQASSAGLNLELAINDTGDGLVFREINGETAGTQGIRVEDVDGSFASDLGLEGVGEVPDIDNPDAINTINASQEVTVTFDASDTLDEALDKINAANGGVRATIINDGSGVSPYRISLVSDSSGRDGRFLIDDHGFDLGLDTLETGEDARVFFGSDDPAKAILLTSSDNTLDDVVTGLSLDLVSASDDVVSITVSRNNESIESTIDTFVEAYNGIIGRLNAVTSFDPDTEQRGALLGDSTAITLRNRLTSVILGQAQGVNGAFSRLSEVGIKLGKEGVIEFDRDRFREALNEDPQAVADVFAARDLIAPELEIEIEDGVTVSNTDTKDQFNQLGVIFQIEELAQSYIDSVDGVLTRRDTTVKTQIKAQERRIEQFDLALDRRRTVLERQFLGMEQALLQLQGQQSALTSLLG